MNINAYVNNTKIFNELQKNTVEGENKSTDFLDTLKEKLNEVNDKQIESDNLTQKFIKGEEEDVHKVMLSTEEAKLSLELAVQIRNKLVDAYQEFNRMQI
ncbi:flagellar hook-basal body complex protein FliE [Clostridium tagluense]|uniref:flagellar hook-basal body complex protein FliE n=1 Tax=Clostridium TaxID=1485 RepID=UPI0013E9246E|nr:MULTISPECIES: flagellar hook-basal body complex protein FliE [Clostridium]MBU3126649.1 flagellar hook-basal body complex protein FliE [Clostridium tagluense]MBZ9624543.1 flagellar hook-basal body complex protein FliE [Clostridium sp. FP2]MCB2310017.1 flagellar hook-basal body complex protein FliE [Clostridium tagluense]MCB2314453.1 flagellar hook-basal body complex protein FliE [Clostridium tagluense]MCB2319301.1 flagellar hook-basal body complex protein FliE [Clostridium tagluense]